MEERYKLLGGELLFAWSGTPGTSFGAHIWSGNAAVLNQHIFRVDYFKECVQKDYFKYAINYKLSELIFAAHGAVGLQHITKSEFEKMIVPLPPLAEQRRIVAAIESAFAVIDEIERNKADLAAAVTAAKSKILSLAIRGKLVPQEPADEPASVLLERIRAERETLVKAGKIKRGKGENAALTSEDNSYYENLPAGWAAALLSELGEIVGGGTPDTSRLEYWENGDIPWLTPADLSEYTEKYIARGSRNITKQGLDKSAARLMPIGSVLFSSRAPIGYIVIASNEICTNQGFKSVVPYIGLTSEYLYCYLQTQVDDINTRAAGSIFKEISGTELGKTLIFLPPLAEQSRIVNAIEAVNKQLDRIAENLN